jgi:hypothetical protein
MKWKKLALPLLAIALTAATLWLTNRTVTPKEATWDDAVAEARDGGYSLINTDELAEYLRKDVGTALLVDTRQEWEFAMGRIKGALNFPMEPTAWSRWWKRGELAAALGADKSRFIAFY